MFGLCFVIQYEKRAGCFTLIVFMISGDCLCSVAGSSSRAVPWDGLQCVIVVFPDNTHLLSSYCLLP